jgi:hypothetical protein
MLLCWMSARCFSCAVPHIEYCDLHVASASTNHHWLLLLLLSLLPQVKGEGLDEEQIAYICAESLKVRRGRHLRIICVTFANHPQCAC